MLKYIKHHMSTIDGIEVYPLISLGIFVLFFTLLAIWVIKADREHIDEMKQMPLETNEH